MSTIKTNSEDLIINADGGSNAVIFQSDGSVVGSVDNEGFKDEIGVILRNSLYPVNALFEVVESTGVITLDTTLYDTFIITTSNIATIAFSGFTVGRTVSLVINRSSETHTITWPTDMWWPDGEEPDLEDGVARVVVQCVDDTTPIYHGAVAGLHYSAVA